MTDPSDPRKYTQEEVALILSRALEVQHSGGLTHQELLEAAREVGIDRSAVETAAREVAERRADELEIAEERRLARRNFYRSVAVYLLVNAFLFAIDLLTGEGWWFYWPLLGWGLGVALQGLRVAFPREIPIEKRRARRAKEQARRRKLEAKAEAERRRLEAKAALERSARAFESSVQHGLATLLESVAHKIQSSVDKARAGTAPGVGSQGVRVDTNSAARPVATEAPEEAAPGREAVRSDRRRGR